MLSNQSVPLSLLEKPAKEHPENGLPMISTNVDVASTAEEQETPHTTRSLASGGSNKLNLRILNLPNPTNDRLVGLTPPMFSPGGRKLPHIHLLPGLGSPGSSNMWSSLLNVTNGPDSMGQFGHPGYAHLASMLRKLGLIPTELNLRTGLTPGIMNQTGFNFNLGTPGGMPSGQMTPGFQTLLGLANNASMVENGMLESHQPFPAPQATSVPPQIHPTMGMPMTTPDHGFAPQQSKVIPEPTTANVGAKPKIAPIPENEVKTEVPEQLEAPASTTQAKRPVSPISNEDEGRTTKKFKGPATAKGKAAKKVEDKKKPTPEETEEDKRKKALERNRVAATKCRQRKKRLLNKMESELEFYSSGFRELSAQVSQLREQLLSLHGVVSCHKDCPTLLRAVGGYQQMQAILAQSEYVALIAPNTEQNVTSMPSTIPTTLNPIEQPHGSMLGQSIISAPNGVIGHPGPIHNGLNVSTMMASESLPANLTNDNINPHSAPMNGVGMNNSGIATMSSNGLYDMSMGKTYNNGYSDGTNLKACNSTSDLQSMKFNQPAENGLRLVVSMADLPGQLPNKS